MNRLLTRRDKAGGHKRSKSSEPNKNSATGILSLFKPDASKKSHEISKDAETTKKLQTLRHRVDEAKLPLVDDAQIEYALGMRYADGDVGKAFDILVMFQEAQEGIVRPYNQEVYMKGAENRAAVTCYLDSLLFAMFARLGSFEPILYHTFDDEPRRRLATLIRLWVNMLRSGKLIHTDITKQLQEALSSCGWNDAARLEQQDTSEAFGFITEKLELPLLTLEMDIYHEGKGDDKDDHKFVKERLLEVAVPADPGDGKAIQLEDCLEDYFNTKVEVVRRLERSNTLQRSNTRGSVVSALSVVDEKAGTSEHVEEAVHIETVEEEAHKTPALELGETSETVVLSPIGESIEVKDFEVPETTDSTPATPATPSTPLTPLVSSRTRATSIIRRRIISEDDPGEGSSDGASLRSSKRKASIRKEVLMPAWQFFRIIPWYTTNVPDNDSQVAAHFSSTRPVLGICLKRYAMDARGHPMRQNTKIDIPLQIALPHFIRDDKATDGTEISGNFNLVLQSMVCHRGSSVHTGHYISVIRGGSQNKDQMPDSKDSNDSPPEYAEDKWIKFDDLASERVSYVDIDEVMEREMPYLLFYQVRPLFGDDDSEDAGITRNRPPSYEDSAIGMVVQEPSPSNEANGVVDHFASKTSYFDGNASASNVNEPKARVSFSDDAERPRNSLSISDAERRGSLAFTDTSTASIYTASMPVTPGEETPPSTQGRLSRAASRFARSGKSKSRPTSVVDEARGNSSNENRISASFSKLNLMRSKEVLNKAAEIPTPAVPTIPSDANAVTAGLDVTTELSKPPSERTGTSGKDFEQTFDHVTVNPMTNPAPAAVAAAAAPAAPLATALGIGRSKSQKKKDKHKSVDVESHGHHHHHSKDKGKGSAKEGGPDQERECVVM